ncbi:conserved hypothetical protein [Methanolacinia petrolearia DSM 11571]|uniref:Uncharacterized protein n=1 Tax=Methanolacinia petrolearia (strain DSM 11571 / OCM 486 / SEBR 4847) TaxID=679926 RepID=E1RET2_METP4|nr:hypothetical protein [Methanolacinia petrolearia]ADN36103.1 conserved hypothetical protein [Methanolacinia petrolearia DSM 11571]
MISEYCAVDIALIPEREGLNFFIGLNRRLIEKTGDDSIHLGDSACLPHISLSMGRVRVSCIEGIKERLSEAVSGYLPYNAVYKGYAVVAGSDGDSVSGMDIVRDDAIAGLQEIVAGILGEFSSKGMTPECFSGDPSVITDFSLDYSENYLARQTGDSFSPHITIGNGDIRKIKRIQPPVNFSCDKIAICRLGNHCTCAEFLGIIKGI